MPARVTFPIAQPASDPAAFTSAALQLCDTPLATGNFRSFVVVPRHEPIVAVQPYGPATGYASVSDAVTAARDYAIATRATDGTGLASLVVKLGERFVPYEANWQLLTDRAIGGVGPISSYTPASDAVMAAVDGAGNVVPRSR